MKNIYQKLKMRHCTWTAREYNLMLAAAMKAGRDDYTAILSLSRYAGLRLAECFRIETLDAVQALENGKLPVKGKGKLTRLVPINESIRIALCNVLKTTSCGQKLFIRPGDKRHFVKRQLYHFVANHRKSFTDRNITIYGLRHTCLHGGDTHV